MLGRLVDDEFVRLEQGQDDKRQRLLSLTDRGHSLEQELTSVQKSRFSRAYKEAGFDSVDGFLTVMQNMLDDQTKTLLSPRPRKK